MSADHGADRVGGCRPGRQEAAAAGVLLDELLEELPDPESDELDAAAAAGSLPPFVDGLPPLEIELEPDRLSVR
ncbi:hypothetical protein ACFQE5_08710 [Pseudonocardia hispaniensis]|uniref:Uncharacterized protein n=1 Tax=Pseudonocardia hispaniensis TaxID=904933 RepID=A0ABW1J0G3_9PSEU